MTPQDPSKIRITLDDLDRVQLPQTAQAAQPPNYGNVAQETAAPVIAESAGSITMKAWFQLGSAGLAGAFIAWAVCEPWFIDHGTHKPWANTILFPLMLVLMCVGFATAESVADHSLRRALQRGLLALALGTVLGFIADFISNIIFLIGMSVLEQGGGYSMKSPSLWITRALAWSVFGAGGGVVYGIIGQSGKRCLYGVLGGILGAGLGGLLFDPVNLLVGRAGASRAVGMCLFGAITGIAIGLVESALKDRWLYVSAGPLAGKQFILYKPLSSIGSSNACDLYLFKDAAIQPQHAFVEMRGPRTVLRPQAPVTVNGRNAGETVLKSGDYVQIGLYGFHYRDRERNKR